MDLRKEEIIHDACGRVGLYSYKSPPPNTLFAPFSVQPIEGINPHDPSPVTKQFAAGAFHAKYRPQGWTTSQGVERSQAEEEPYFHVLGPDHEIWSSNTHLHQSSQREKLPIMWRSFALDHVHYSRWTPVHIRDIKSLPATVKKGFDQHSHWVLSKTSNKLSSIPFDQAHEQENKIVKGAGGAIGLLENPAALRRWMLSGPEMAIDRML